MTPPRQKRPCSIEGCTKRVHCRQMCNAHYLQWRQTADRSEIGQWKDPEYRFHRATRWGRPSSHRPDLGPCLLYIGADNGNGYGQFTYPNGKKNGYAHRYAWERANGPIPAGLTVDHLCRVRRCVNAAHMELVDGVENYLRAVRIRTRCRNGKHEYTPENTIIRKDGRRICRACKEETGRRNGLRATKAVRGIEDNRAKFDLLKRDRLVVEAVERRMTVRQAAEALGCTYKYMDKLVRRESQARGVPNRRKHRGPVLCAGWTECTTRVAVQERSNGVCERCDASRATDMHHRKNRSQSGKWHPANIMHLCRLCHVEITSEPKKSTQAGWTVQERENPADVPVVYRGRRALLNDQCHVVFISDAQSA